MNCCKFCRFLLFVLLFDLVCVPLFSGQAMRTVMMFLPKFRLKKNRPRKVRARHLRLRNLRQREEEPGLVLCKCIFLTCVYTI